MVEGARLESVFRGNSNVGSNPTRTASRDSRIKTASSLAFCRLMSSGCASLADDAEHVSPDRASELTTRALRFQSIAAELSACATLWRRDSLD